MNFPDVPEMYYDEEMTINNTLNVITALKEEPAVEFPKRFKNRWEEVQTLTKSNISLNLGL